MRLALVDPDKQGPIEFTHVQKEMLGFAHFQIGIAGDLGTWLL